MTRGIWMVFLVFLCIVGFSSPSFSATNLDTWSDASRNKAGAGFGTSINNKGLSSDQEMSFGSSVISGNLKTSDRMLSRIDFGGLTPQEAIMNTMIDLQSNPTPVSLKTYDDMSRSELIETRLLLEKSLSVQGGFTRESTENLLFQFDTLVAKPVINRLSTKTFGSTQSFLSPVTSESLITLPDLELKYLSALNDGKNIEALGIRNEIIQVKASEFINTGIDPIVALDMAQTYLSLSTDSVAVAVGLDQEVLKQVITSSLKLQGLAAGQVNGSAARLLGFSLSPENVGRAVPYGDAMDSPIDTALSVSSGVPEANKWLVEQRTGKSQKIIKADLSDLSIKDNIGYGDNIKSNSFLDDIGNPFKDQISREVADVAQSIATNPSSFDPFAWAKEIRLSNTDLVLNMLKRWFGGPVDALYSYVTNSDGSFKSVMTGGSSINSGAGTGSYTALTLLVYFVLLMSLLLASFYFLYGLYKGGMEGTFFGQQNDTGMILGRSIVSLAGNLPIPSLFGLTVIQAVVFFGIFFSLAVSSGMSTTLAKNFISKPIIDPVPVTNEGFAGSIFKSQACMALLYEFDELIGDEKYGKNYKAKFNGLEVISDNEVASTSVVDAEESAWTWVKSFFITEYDPLDPRTSESVRFGYIDDVYENNGFLLNQEITRYRFGNRGRCGEFFVATGMSNFSEEELKLAERSNEGFIPGGSPNREMTYDNKLSNVGKKDVAALQNTAQYLYEKWNNEVEEIKLNTAETLIDVLIDKSSVSVEKMVEDYFESGVNRVSLPKAMEELESISSNFYNEWAKMLFQKMSQTDNPSDELVINTISELGMGSLGGIYWFIDLRQKQIMSFYDFTIMSSKPVPVSGESDFVNSTNFKDKATPIYTALDTGFGSKGVKLAKEMLHSSAAGNSVADDSVNSLANILFQDDWFADIDNFNGSPIERVRHLGNVLQTSLLTTGITLAIIEASAKGIKNTVPEGFFRGLAAAAGSIIGRATEMFQSMAGPLFIGAFICSNIVPAMPYIMFTAAIIGLLVHYASFLVGVPIWWMQKMHLNGSEMTGQSGPGYTVFLLLVLRAPMIVIGFFLGMGLNWIAGQFINMTFMPATAMNSAGSFNPTGYVGEVLIFSGLHLFACYKSFHLTWELPNFVASLIGSSPGGDLGEGDMKGMALGFAHAGGGASVGGALTKFSPSSDDKEGETGSGSGDNDGPENGGGGASGKGSEGVNKTNSNESGMNGSNEPDSGAGKYNKAPSGADANANSSGGNLTVKK